MDGSYGNVLPTSKAMSPAITATSGNDRYKVNVSRQKTKKWANFKPANYEGDEWGADYDEPSDEPEPPLPTKPLGPRHQGAHAPTYIPYNPDEPPLLPSQRPAQPERRATEPIGSPEPKPPGAAGSNEPPHPRPALSPFPKQSVSPPKSPSSPPWLPSQKGSMGPSGAADAIGAARQFASGPGLNNNPDSRVKTRSTFPVNTPSPSSSNKPLPFIRPADLYRRMEEERGQERRPSDPRIPGPQDALGLGMNLQNNAQNYPAGLPTVAERKSEYGIEGLLDSYGPEEPTEANSPEAPKSAPPVMHDKLRRFSRSPQLPDVSRLSGFGEDLFSSSSFFPESKLQSSVSESTHPSISAQPASDLIQSVAAEEAPVKSPPVTEAAKSTTPDLALDAGTPQHIPSANADVDAVTPPLNEHDRLIEQPSHEQSSSVIQPAVDATEQQRSAAVAQEVTSCDTEQPAATPIRPPLPGGWVTETAPTPTELPPSTRTSPSQEGRSKAAEPQESPSAIVADAQSEVTSPNSNETESGKEENMKESDSAGKESSSPVRPTSPHALPPLRTSSPALSAKLEMPSQQPASKPQSRDASPSRTQPQASESSSPVPNSATTQHSEIIPTAPLNPRRASPDSETKSSLDPTVAPLSFGTKSTLDTSSSSPIKDNDMLSEEIMKSLSPIQSSSDLTGAAEGSTAAYRAAAEPTREPTRESSYLGDVYGDYWAATEDKADPVPPLTEKAGDPEKNPQAPSSLRVEPKGTEQPPESSGNGFGASTGSSQTAVEVSDAQPRTSSGVGGLRRFSWEAPAPAKEPAVEQKVLGSEAPGVAELEGSVAAPIQRAELETPANVPLPLSPIGEDTKEGSSIPEAVEVSTEKIPAPGLLSKSPLDRAVDTPSPLSSLSEKRDASHRLSLAEEKIVLQESTTPVSPPLEQHPAFASPPQQTPARASSPKKEPVNIPPFRSIMELPSPTERIKQYNEARFNISSVDTGLAEWLREMMAKHPEHTNAPFAVPVPGGAPTHSQQGGSQISGLATHMPHVLGHASAGLVHSGGQVGTKSKELLMAAGKAGKGFGKGLLNKGRSKLRGTG